MDPMQPFRDEVVRLTSDAVRKLGADVQFEVEVPSPELADFAIPCFPLAKKLRKAPAAIADELAKNIASSDRLTKVWADKGYLNFRVNEQMLIDSTLKAVLAEKENYGRGEKKDKKVLLEHTSVNPTGPIHVGRARNPLIGDTLARILRRCGYDVTTEYYVNDVGKQVVLLTWGINNVPESEVKPADRDKADHRLVGYYQRANEMMESDPEVGRQIADMLVRFEAGDPAVIETVGETAKLMLQGIGSSLESVGVKVDQFTWESKFILNGQAKEVVAKLKASPKCMQEEGASYLDLEELSTQGKSTKFFFTRSDGTTLYTTRDLAYHLDKFKRADMWINVLGEDQKLGMTHLAAALRIMGVDKVPECVFYSFVALPEGRMSTRKGRVVYLDDLIEEAQDRALEEVKKRRFDISEERMFRIAQQIGAGSIRYNIIRVQAEKQFVFQWEEALNFEGNSAPFLQYAHARCCSILRKAPSYDRNANFALLSNEAEKKLIRVLSLFPSTVREAGEKRKIHVIPAYGHELASAFNQFYGVSPVLNSGEVQDARLCLVEATMWALRDVLDTLGIAAPEEM
ncbi:MAG: Arginine--tRNA ligase [Methanomassiliicoccales archaeon PtaU1.Bin124]|nr:MAG: Arginine--tRNA ligase [Methanomassiliicoccales archaeon PtaU1.Bin124]